MATAPVRLRTVLLIWTAATFLPAWLVTIRGLFDGEAYAWGVTETIKGRGISGYYPVAPAAALLGLSILTLGWRGAMRPFHLLLALWHIPLGVLASVAARRNRGALRLQGDTLGIDISLATVAPIVLGAAATGSACLALLERKTIPAASSPPNRPILTAAAALLPVQFVLLRNGEQNGLTDKLGVVLIIIQWVLINVGLAVRGR